MVFRVTKGQFSLLVMAILMWAGVCHGSANEDELVFLADHFPPYEYASPKGKPHGFDSEVIQAVFKRLKIPVRIEFQPWKRVVANVESGQVSGMFSCAYSKKRVDFSYLSDPISFATQGVVVNNSYKGATISKLSDLRGLRVASVAGYASNRYLEDARVEFTSLPHISHAFPMLSHGRFDAFFLSLEAGRFLAAEAGLAGSLKFIQLLDIERRNYHLCFSKKRKGYKTLAEQFNQALEQLKTSGEYQAIHKKYL
ncbi:MAG: transporter substrate-binding domain-containing protein [Bermanella sp.]